MIQSTAISLKGLKVLVTGGAGFIGSNICEYLLHRGAIVRCFDNLSTGKKENITSYIADSSFQFFEGDIRDLAACRQAVDGMTYVLHQAALGSVPRSVKDPITTNEVNIGGFLNMLVASKDAGVKRFVYAASSSTYGDSKTLPKVEDTIGKPLSPYAITKYVNELYADVFYKTYGLESIGLRYFNVFGRKQDPEGAYAAVIPKFVKQFMSLESPVFNGDGTYSRDFTYVDNVIQANVKAMLIDREGAVNEVYNIACGERIDLITLASLLKDVLKEKDKRIDEVVPKKGSPRDGDIPHSLASIEKAKKLLGYVPEFSVRDGIVEAVDWYWNNL